MRYLVGTGIHDDYKVVYSAGSDKEADDLVDALNRTKESYTESYYKVEVEEVVAKEGYLDEFLLVSVHHDNKYSSRFDEVTYSKFLRFQLEGLKVGYEKFEHTSYYSELYEGVEKEDFSEWEFMERALEAVKQGASFTTDLVRGPEVKLDMYGVSFEEHLKEVVSEMDYVAYKLGKVGDLRYAEAMRRLVLMKYIAEARSSRLLDFCTGKASAVSSDDLKMFRQAIKQFKQKYKEVK